MFFLYLQLGWASLVALVVLILMMPVQVRDCMQMESGLQKLS